MRVLLLFIISCFIISSCKDDDSGSTSCCGSGISDLPAKIFVPTAVTPNGDGLNDEFSIFAPASTDLLHITNFKAKMGTRTLVEIDTFLMGSGTSVKWDVKDTTGSPVYGSIQLSYVVTDTALHPTAVYHDICSFDCTVNPGNAKDISKCKFSDQIDPNNGFVFPTSETPCN